MRGMTDQQPIPAATLVLFRERPDGPPEMLMVERSKGMAFAAGAMVFPGGRIDPEDERLAQAHPDLPDAAARIAAIRETLEEAGIAIGISPALSSDASAAMRAGLHSGEAFGSMLDRAGAALDLDALTPFARWLPAHKHARIFDTLFYLARAPDGIEATVDRTENVRLVWTTAAAMLAQVDAGRAQAIFPTRRNLERLARFASFEEAVADARAHPIVPITPFIERRDGEDFLLIPDGLGYPVTAEPLTSATRG